MQGVELNATRYCIWAWVLELNRWFELCELQQVTEYLWALLSIETITRPSSNAYCGDKNKIMANRDSDQIK